MSCAIPVSFVVIGRNEEEHIAKALNAAVFCAQNVNGEVVYVDCGSTDSTVAIALSFCVKVVQIPVHSILSAAAARWVGTQIATGEYIMYIDGDCEVADSWIEAGIQILNKNKEIAGVNGRLDEVYYEDGVVVGQRENALGLIPEKPAVTIWLGGNSLLRRSALELVDGGFNPIIKSLEEPELCFRLMKNGMRIVSIPDKMATHYTENRWTLKTVIGRFKRGLCIGYGQVLRSSIRNGFLLRFVSRENRTFLFLLALIMVLPLGVMDCIIGKLFYIPLWGAIMGTAYVYLAIKNRSLVWPTLMYTTWFLNCLGICQGIIKPLPEPSQCHVEHFVVESSTRNI